MARTKSKGETRSFNIDAPGCLDAREFAAFRLGALKMMLAVADDAHVGFSIPGIYRMAFEEEILQREAYLDEEPTD